MSRKNTLKYPLLTGQSLSADFISPVTFIRNTDNVSYQIDATGAGSSGFFYVEVSNNYAVGPDALVTNPGTWVRLTLSGQPALAGADDIIGISLNQLPYDAIRLVYDSTVAGAGSCSVVLTSKTVGA